MKQSTSKLFRALLWGGGIFGGLILSLGVAYEVMMFRLGDVPADLDYSTTRLSDNGIFKVSYIASTGNVPVNQIHEWRLHIETAVGQPVNDAVIGVEGDMPQHGHGLPTRPQVTKSLGNGDYLVEGVKFQMGGWWLMDFTIATGDNQDVVHFNMMLK